MFSPIILIFLTFNFPVNRKIEGDKYQKSFLGKKMDNTLSTIPRELIYKIGDNLDYNDLLKLCTTSKILNSLCTDISFLLELIAKYRSVTGLFNKSSKFLLSVYKKLSDTGYACTFEDGDCEPIIYPGGNVADVLNVSVSKYHAAVVTTQGNIYTRGKNNYGQLGTGDFNDGFYWMLIPGFNNVIKVSCGLRHTALITDKGKLYTFGDNSEGQLVLGYEDRKNIPTRKYAYDNIIDVACSHLATIFVTVTGNIYICGLLKNKPSIKIPQRLPGFSNVVSVSCGTFHAVLLTTEGQIYGWGNNLDGQLGLGDIVDRPSPTRIGNFTDVINVSCGGYHTAFVTSEGKAYACGYNGLGQLGTYDTRNRMQPTPITGFNDIVSVSCGNSYTLLTTNKEKIYLLGEDVYSHLIIKYKNSSSITHLFRGFSQ